MMIDLHKKADKYWTLVIELSNIWSENWLILSHNERIENLMILKIKFVREMATDYHEIYWLQIYKLL